MTTNKLELDLSDPAMAEAVADCKPGDTKTFTVTVTAEKHDGKTFVGHVDEIEYADAPEGEGEEDYAPPSPPAEPSEGNAIMLVLKKK